MRHAPPNVLVLERAVNECEASAMLPLECQYLNKNALTTLAGPLTPPVKHFQLKRKPKSATLRAELLQKCECPRARVWAGAARGGPAAVARPPAKQAAPVLGLELLFLDFFGGLRYLSCLLFGGGRACGMQKLLGQGIEPSPQQ